jgi:hypothetical protein
VVSSGSGMTVLAGENNCTWSSRRPIEIATGALFSV